MLDLCPARNQDEEFGPKCRARSKISASKSSESDASEIELGMGSIRAGIGVVAQHGDHEQSSLVWNQSMEAPLKLLSQQENLPLFLDK